MLVHRAPEPMLPACDADHNLVEVPFVSGRRKTAADLVGEALPELHRPLPHRLMTDLDASGGEHLLDHAQAQGKPEIQPDGIADHLSREAVAGVARVAGRVHPSPMPASRHSTVNLTVPTGRSPPSSRSFACTLMQADKPPETITPVCEKSAWERCVTYCEPPEGPLHFTSADLWLTSVLRHMLLFARRH